MKLFGFDYSTSGATNFKFLAISEIMNLALMNSIFTEIIDFLSKYKNFSCGNQRLSKMLFKSYEYGDFKQVCRFGKLVSLWFSCVKKLCNHNFYAWKVIPL